MTNYDAARSALVQTVANCREYLARGDIQNKQWADGLPKYEARLAKFDALRPDIDGIMLMDKVAIREVPAETFDFVKEVLWSNCGAGSAVFFAEVTRRKAAATKAARAAQQAAREASGVVYTPSQQVEVHAMGHWYKGEVVRINRTGGVVVRYTSGAGVTREKTVGSEKIR